MTPEELSNAIKADPTRAVAFVTAAITAAPTQAGAFVTAAITAAPTQAGAFVAAAITAAPTQAGAIVTAAVTALPASAAAIVAAAITAAPDQAEAITAAAITAAPDQAEAITAAAAAVPENPLNPPPGGGTAPPSGEGGGGTPPPVIPPPVPTVPSAPTSLVASPGNGSVFITFTPGSDGGSAITSYTVTSNPGGLTYSTSDNTPYKTITGLTNGTSYTFTVTATNSVGASVASSASNAVVPYTTPDAPTNVIATVGDGQVTVSWSVPNNGGSAITSYTVTSNPDGLIYDTLDDTLDDTPNIYISTGLTNGTSYTFTVTATNSVGASVASSASNAVVPYTPSAPTSLLAIPGNNSVEISFTAGSNGGSPITNYKYSINDGVWNAFSPPVTTSLVTISNTPNGPLINGTTYNIKLCAVNTAGDGTPSDSVSVTPRIVDAVVWTARTASAPNSWSSWTSVTYGNGKFVAVSSDGTNRVMTSPNGILWTESYTAPVANWRSVTYGNGLFVAVAYNGTHHVMTSPNGIIWTARTASQQSPWTSVTYGNGTFVAVSNDGGVMTSPDGITWTPRDTVSGENYWYSITYGNGLFVAVAYWGDNLVMTSADGIIWTARTASQQSPWTSVTYGNGLFVAVSNGETNHVMTSSDGITWTGRTASEANWWNSVTYGNGLFVAVSSYGENRVMTSPDGITWTARTASAANQWISVTYGNGLFVAVSDDGTNRVMTSPLVSIPYAPTITSVTPGNSSVTVAFTAPSYTGRSAITNYEYQLNGSGSWVALSTLNITSPITITGLTNGTTYTIKLRAVNGDGGGVASQMVTIRVGTVTITGTATQGQTLTASTTLDDSGELGTISFQWKANSSDIVDAKESAFLLTQDQVGKTITVTATYTDIAGNSGSVTSTATSAIANVNDLPTGTVTITGTATQGETLTVNSTLDDIDGLGTISYQWKADGSNITGATSRTLVLGLDQVGKTITVTASYTDSADNSESVTSTATSIVIPLQTTSSESAIVNESYTWNGTTYTQSGIYTHVVKKTINNKIFDIEIITLSLTIVMRQTPTITIIPTASDIVYGQTLDNSVLSGGAGSVSGEFAFTTLSTPLGVGTSSQSVTFTPIDTTNYTTTTTTVSVTVSKANSTIVVVGSSNYVYTGVSLGPDEVDKTGSTGAVTYAYTGTESTTYTSSTKPTVSGTYQVIATLAADSNYNSEISAPYAFTIAKANSTIVVVGSATYVYAGSQLGPDEVDKTGSTGAVTYAYTGTESTTYTSSTKPTVSGTYQVIATLAADSNYNSEISEPFDFTIAKATPTTTPPTASDITYGQMLADSVLSGGSASVEGTFTFTTPSTSPSVGTTNQNVTFTPNDTNNYTTTTTTVSVITHPVLPGPSNVRAIVGTGTATVIWSAPSTLPDGYTIAGYKITSTVGTFNELATVTQIFLPLFTADGTIYTLSVEAVYMNGATSPLVNLSVLPIDLTNLNISTLSEAQLNALSVNQLSALSTTQISSLSVNQLNAFTVAQLDALQKTQTANLSEEKKSGIATTLITKATPSEVDAAKKKLNNLFPGSSFTINNQDDITRFVNSKIMASGLEPLTTVETKTLDDNNKINLGTNYSKNTGIYLPLPVGNTAAVTFGGNTQAGSTKGGVTKDVEYMGYNEGVKIGGEKYKPSVNPINLGTYKNDTGDNVSVNATSAGEGGVIFGKITETVDCLTENTLVLTPSGYVKVSLLKEGDYVLTDDNRQVTITKYSRFMTENNNPYIIEKNSIGPNYPPEDISISGGHLIKYNNKWLLPSDMKNTKRDNSQAIVKYYHIALENYITDNLVINGGSVVESYGQHSKRNNKEWIRRKNN